MTTTRQRLTKYLEPSEILCELLEGLVSVLTITLGASVLIGKGHDMVQTMVVATLGCSVASGVIDGGTFIVTRMFDRSLDARLMSAIQQTDNEEDGLAMVRAKLDPMLASLASESTRAQLYAEALRYLRDATLPRVRVTKDDVFGAMTTIWYFVLPAILAIIPFLVFDEWQVALRVSNALLLGMLFFVGHQWGRLVHARPWGSGLAMLLFGSVLVALAIALGG